MIYYVIAIILVFHGSLTASTPAPTENRSSAKPHLRKASVVEAPCSVGYRSLNRTCIPIPTSGAPQRTSNGETGTATMTIELRFVVSALCYRGTIRIKGRCLKVWIEMRCDVFKISS
ncbi:hypothetical protein Trydic_g9691 [Trypoxylus dichotomus]